MPIQFRCPHCTRLLGVARRKAGAQVRCPRCGRPATVPGGDGSNPFDDLDEALAPAGVGATPAAVAAKPAARPSDHDPLFEADDLDAILGVKGAGGPLDLDDPPPRARPVSGSDAASLPDDDRIVLSSQKAVALGIVAAVMLVVAFALGVLVGSKW